MLKLDFYSISVNYSLSTEAKIFFFSIFSCFIATILDNLSRHNEFFHKKIKFLKIQPFAFQMSPYSTSEDDYFPFYKQIDYCTNFLVNL